MPCKFFLFAKWGSSRPSWIVARNWRLVCGQHLKQGRWSICGRQLCPKCWKYGYCQKRTEFYGDKTDQKGKTEVRNSPVLVCSWWPGLLWFLGFWLGKWYPDFFACFQVPSGIPVGHQAPYNCSLIAFPVPPFDLKLPWELHTPARGSPAGSSLSWAAQSQAKCHPVGWSQPALKSAHAQGYSTVGTLFLDNDSVGSFKSMSLETETSFISLKWQYVGLRETQGSFVTICFLLVVQLWKVKVLVAQSCPTVCDPMDPWIPGSSVHGILQARTLKWLAIPFSRGDLPNLGIEPGSPALQADSLLSELPSSALIPFNSQTISWTTQLWGNPTELAEPLETLLSCKRIWEAESDVPKTAWCFVKGWAWGSRSELSTCFSAHHRGSTNISEIKSN